MLALSSGFKGLIKHPKRMMIRIIAAVISMAPFQPKLSINLKMITMKTDVIMTNTYSLVRGANMKVPNPEPHTAIPVAKARFFSK